MDNEQTSQTPASPAKPKTAKEITREMIKNAARKNGGKLATPRGQEQPYDARKFRRF